MTQQRTVTFLRPVPPNGPGDVAGLPAAVAARLIASGHAEEYDPARAVVQAVDLSVMDRAALISHGRAILGFEDDPPEEVTDDELRAAIQAHHDGMPVPDAPVEVALDQLDALDRPHLEAFAISKAGFEHVDSALSDDELRAQIRAAVEASVSSVAPHAPKKGRKGA